MKAAIISGICALLVFVSIAGHAAGIGIYGTGGIARSSWTGSGARAVNSNDYFYGGGLVIDTAVAKDSPLNYRFRAGYNRFFRWMLNFGLSIPINDVNMYHTIGFGVLRTKTIRFWIGPQVGFHYLFADQSRTHYQVEFQLIPTYTPYLVYPVKTRTVFRYVEFDLLLAMGVNVNLGDLVTLFLEVGAGYEGKFSVDGPGTGHGIGVLANAGIMFRVRDRYEKKEAK